MQTELREEFCGACLAMPLAMAGSSVGAWGAKKAGGKKKIRYRKQKKQELILGLSITLLIFAFGIYKLRTCSSCK